MLLFFYHPLRCSQRVSAAVLLHGAHITTGNNNPRDTLMPKAQVVVAVAFPEQQQPMCRLLMCKCCICCAAPMARGHMKQGTRLMVIA